MLGEYSDAGYREPKDKLMYSLRENAQYYAMVFGSGILGLVYVFISSGAPPTSKLKGLVMALAYCWGLTLAIYLMGHGLVAIPRRLMRDASISKRLRRIQSQAPKLYEKMEEADMNLEDVEIQVSELSRRKVGSARDFQDWIEELVDMTSLPEAHPRPGVLQGSGEARALPTVITEKYMADLTRQLVRARHARSRYAGEWNKLLQDATDTQAILDSAGSKKLDFGAHSPQSGFWDRFNLLNPYTRYLYHYHFIPYARLFVGGFLALASTCIVWSEIVKVGKTTLPKLSIISLTVVHHWTGDKGQVGFAGQLIASFWILYMCAAALTSITEIKVWRGRALVRRNTAHESAFWYASQVARLSVPLSYNFLTFLSADVYTKTNFYGFLGQLIVLTPLGEWFDKLFPLFILVPVCATLFGLYGKVKRFFGLADIIDDQDEENESGYGTGSWREGRDLIEREIHGTSIRSRQSAAAARLAAGRTDSPTGRAAPVLSIPGSRRTETPITPFGTSPNAVGSTAGTASASRAGRQLGHSSRAPLDGGAADDDNFFAALGHRIKNTVDTIDTPKWFQDIKKPKWMGNSDDDGEGSSRPAGGRNDSDFRRWFGGGNDGGRIRL